MPATPDMGGLLLAALLLAFMAEGTTEYLFATPLARIVADAEWRTTATRYIALLVGVAVAFGYNLDIIAVIAPGLVPVAPWVGVALTGIVIGRGSNYLNDFASRFFVKP
jgi:archaellum biogenesis protein FlaJ (TadC family)